MRRDPAPIAEAAEPAEAPPIDAATFRAFQEGSAEAARAIVEAYQPRLAGFLYMRTRNRELAEELCQEVFIAACRQRTSILGPAHLRPWLFTVAKRKAIKETSRRRHGAEIAMEADLLADIAPAASPEQGRSRLAGQARALLAGALSKLLPAERELIELRFFAEMQIKEVAETMDMPMGTVGVKLGRTLKKIRDHLEADGIALEDLLP